MNENDSLSLGNYFPPGLPELQLQRPWTWVLFKLLPFQGKKRLRKSCLLFLHPQPADDRMRLLKPRVRIIFLSFKNFTKILKEKRTKWWCYKKGPQVQLISIQENKLWFLHHLTKTAYLTKIWALPQRHKVICSED